MDHRSRSRWRVEEADERRCKLVGGFLGHVMAAGGGDAAQVSCPGTPHGQDVAVQILHVVGGVTNGNGNP